jgi:hypothetical protein
MTPFYRATATRTYQDTVARHLALGLSPDEAKRCADHLRRCVIWKNDTYQVLVDQTPPHGLGPDFVVWYLSIRRLDREPIHDWRHLQQIKNELCGKECEGAELYPAESRVVDGANQYHMHVIMHPIGFRFPWGFWPPGPARSTPEQAATFGAKQREHTS